ncbi:hypothetical protein DY000_02043778 [Brassica cretica]|uniref:Uncharacterized protein n=1 Tax=Brassica cretica TaxID=69181 RepID=A0ABQ7BAA5_BRACR|nr:hypothetical protein DY000_02043778 [Brassica cretica]
MAAFDFVAIPVSAPYSACGRVARGELVGPKGRGFDLLPQICPSVWPGNWVSNSHSNKWAAPRRGVSFTHLLGPFPWVRLGSGPLHPERLYLGWGQGPTPSTAFGDRMGSSPPPGVKPVSMTIGPQGPYELSYLVPSENVMFLLCLN